MDDDTDQPVASIAGATGGTGRELVELLSPRALTVRRLTRSANDREALEARGADEVVVGDPFESTDAGRATAGVDPAIGGGVVAAGRRGGQTSRSTASTPVGCCLRRSTTA